MREFSRLLRFTGRYWGAVAAAMLLMIAVGALEGIFALLVAPVINTVLQPHGSGRQIFFFHANGWIHHSITLNQFIPTWFSHNPASVVLGALVLAVVLKGFAEYGGGYLINFVGFGVVTDVRNALYEKLIHQSAAFFQRHTTAKLMSTAINDIDRIQTAMSHSLATALQQGFTMMFLVLVLFALNWRLALASLLLTPLVLVPAARLGRNVRRTTRRGQDQLADVQHILHETLTGNRIVKAFSMEWREIQRFREAALRLLRVRLRYILEQGVSSPLMEILGVVTFALLMLYMRGQINRQIMSLGAVMSFFYALLKLYDPLRRMAGVYNSFQAAAGAAQEVFLYMDTAEEVKERAGARKLRPFREEVRFAGVEFSYGSEQPVLRGIELTVRRGEVAAIVGASGAGKTTLVNLLPRFFDATAGQVLIDGQDVREATLQSLREQIAYVTQDTILFNATAGENIAYGVHDAHPSRIRAAARAALAAEFVEALPEGYDTLLGERGLRLSGGQRQRIAIARALLKDAPILILDEATSALDTESEMLVQRALNNLMQNRTVLVIAHRLSTVRRADRIVVLERGQVAEMGTHEELMARNGAYRRLHDLQFADVTGVEIAAGAPGAAQGAS